MATEHPFQNFLSKNDHKIELVLLHTIGNVQILRHRVRGGWDPDTNDDIDDAIRA